jgi:hypothetical protein
VHTIGWAIEFNLTNFVQNIYCGAMQSIKMVIIGARGVGKTSLAMKSASFCRHNGEKYLFRDIHLYLTFGHSCFDVALLDQQPLGGLMEESYVRLRAGCVYPETDAFFVVFSLTDRDSLEEVTVQRWVDFLCF